MVKPPEALQSGEPVEKTVTDTVTVLAALNPQRGQLLIWSPPAASPVTAYVALSATAAVTTTLRSVELTPSTTQGAYWELPTFGGQVWVGPVVAICAAGQTVSLLVTEISE